MEKKSKVFLGIISFLLVFGATAYALNFDEDFIRNLIIYSPILCDLGILCDNEVRYGEMWVKNNTNATIIPAANIYVNITDNSSSGNIRGFTFSSGKLTANDPGIYSVMVSLASIGGNNKLYDYTIGINGIDQDNCHIRRKMSGGGDEGAIPISCLIDVEVGDVMTVMVENKNDATDVTITNMNLWMIRIDV